MNYIKNEEEFNEVIKKDKVSKEMNLDTYKVNVDEVEDVARQYGIMSIPTVMIFEKGKMTKKNVGFMDDAELREFVK